MQLCVEEVKRHAKHDDGYYHGDEGVGHALAFGALFLDFFRLVVGKVLGNGACGSGRGEFVAKLVRRGNSVSGHDLKGICQSDESVTGNAACNACGNCQTVV